MASIELKFQGTFNKSDYLSEFSCGCCQRYLSQKDISQGNYRLYVSDYANEVSKDDYFSEWLGHYLTTYGLTFWLKAVKHLGVNPSLPFSSFRTSSFVLVVYFSVFAFRSFHSPKNKSLFFLTILSVSFCSSSETCPLIFLTFISSLDLVSVFSNQNSISPREVSI
jgi:hypothetical protein